MATAAQIEPSWLRNLKNSASFSPQALASVTSWQLFGAASGLVLITGIFLNQTAARIADTALQRGYKLKGSRKELEILDARFGYTLEEAYHLLKAWGPSGRRLYLYIEAADTFAFITGYRAAAVVLTNRLVHVLARMWPAFQLPLPLVLFPVVLATIDYAENLLQSSATLMFNDAWATPAAASRPWKVTVSCACLVNKAKWTTARLWGGCMVVGSVAALFKVLKGG